MTQHKWHKEIKAWADGAEIERRYLRTDNEWSIWVETDNPSWNETGEDEYRIKTQPKGPQYLYVYKETEHSDLTIVETEIEDWHKDYTSYIGKIKLEVDNEPVHST